MAVTRWLGKAARLSLFLSCGWSVGGVAAGPEDLTELSLEELMKIEVTTVSKKSQKLSSAAAAVYVISHEDIRRSGATSIPEALRLAPGLNVARISSNSWAISSRGFNGRFANKLQVLIDGRSVYTPTFSGVYWEAQDTRMEDIERIEVIRGPGATLWGSNAVNGIINVITKHARQTQGGEFSFGGGTYEKRFGSLRYGGQLAEDVYGRAFVKGFARGAFDQAAGGSAHDDWDSVRGGFRVDGESGDDNSSWTVQGDAYKGTLGEGLNLPKLLPPYMAYTLGRTPVSGFNLLGRWKKTLSDRSEITVQSYYDHTYRDDLFITEQRDTFDFDFQHHFVWQNNHDVVWGLGYRWTRPEYSQRYPALFDTSHPVLQLFSAYVQDEISLIPSRLKFIAGAKLEHNTYTGIEGQPNFRLLWTPDPHHTLWGAISRAVRIPAFIEDAASITMVDVPPGHPGNPSPFPLSTGTVGNGQFRAEVLWAYELGYRFMPKPNFSVDVAAFYNDYSRLRSSVVDLNSITPGERGLVLMLPFGNNIRGQTYGVEIALDWQPFDWWRWQINYTCLRMALRTKPDNEPARGSLIEGASPQQQVSIRSGFAPSRDVDVDFWLRYVDRLPASGVPQAYFTTYVPAYVTLDARLAWRPLSNVELSLVGQNLLDSGHPEFAQEIFAPALSGVPRSVYAKIDWRF